MNVSPVPPGYHTVTPYLHVKGADQVVQFLVEVFDAEKREILTAPNGLVIHGEVKVGNSIVMISEAQSAHAPMPGMLYVYLPDVDALYERALRAGGTSVQPPQYAFYGDRVAGVRDIAGNEWWIATRVEEVTPDELLSRMGKPPASD